MSRRGSLASAGAASLALVGAWSAIASPLSTPTPRSPRNGAHVRSGHVTLIVKDPGVPKADAPVYATISNRRKLDQHGHLAVRYNCNGRCDFIALHRWRGHPGFWIVHAPNGFKPWWTETPGRYYWQAVHTAPNCAAPGCTVAGPIHSFIVR